MTKINRAYSFLEIKEMNEGNERVFRGIATSPNPDRVGDIVEPLGVSFKNPLPLLFHHDSRLPIGLVTFEKPTKKGIAFEARLPIINEPGVLKDRIDEAWQSIKHGLIRAVSIGFRTLEYEQIKETGGLRFLKSEVMELSAVVIPANADAIISSVKSFDTGLDETKSVEAVEKINSEATEVLAVQAKEFVSKASSPGVTGTRIVKINTNGRSAPLKKETIDMKSYADQIADFEATLATKNARIEAILGDAAEAGQTLDGAQEEEFDTLQEEIKSIEKHIGRLQVASKSAAATAKPVDGQTQKSATEARAGVVLKAPKLEKGIEFARFAMAIGAAKGNVPQALEIAKGRFGENSDVTTSLKAAVAAGSTTDPTWAAPLVDTYQRFTGDFLEYLRPQTIIGKFGANGVPGLRRIPFNVSIVGQTSGGSAGWVGEGAAKPLTRFDYNDVNLRWAKVAAIAVITEELLRFSNPAAEALVRDNLAAAVIERLDIDFVDPAKAAVTNVSPASITNGVTPIVSSGTDTDAIRSDIKALMQSYLAANITPTTAVWIMPSMVALSLSLMTNPLGQREFPNVALNGGNFNGMPVIVSDYVPAGTVILANASDIFLADDGQVTLDASREASLQMDTAPTGNSLTGSGTATVSMFQTNSVAIRAERYINWQKRRASAVAVLTGVAWGGEPTT